MDNKVKKIVDEWFAKREAARQKEEFKMRLKYGKPQGRTRPPFR